MAIRTAITRVGHQATESGRALADVQTWLPLLLGQMRRLGVDSVPIAVFIAVFTGIVLSLLSKYIFTGAVPLYFVGALVGKTIMMELETLAYNPRSYLVVPRVLAGGLMFPAVTALAIAVGVTAGWITAINLLDLSTLEFVKGLRLFYRFKDIWFGLLKAASFGIAVTLAGCIQGLATRGGAEGVGRNTIAHRVAERH